MIKAAFFDIDGTLVSFKTHSIPESTKSAIAELKEKGIKTFIATGRPFYAIDNLDGLEFDGYITMNGACCLNRELQVIYSNPVSCDNIDSLIRYQKEVFSFPCMFASKDEVFVNRIDENVEEIIRQINFITPDIRPLEDACKEEVLQLMGFFGIEREPEIMEIALPDCIAARWSPLFTDIVAKGTSKQTGMDCLLDFYDINIRDVIAFGDGGNDIPMLQHAPLSVAMGNAREEVKKSASYITDHIDEDGIRKALEHLEIIGKS